MSSSFKENQNNNNNSHTILTNIISNHKQNNDLIKTKLNKYKIKNKSSQNCNFSIFTDEQLQYLKQNNQFIKNQAQNLKFKNLSQDLKLDANQIHEQPTNKIINIILFIKKQFQKDISLKLLKIILIILILLCLLIKFNHMFYQYQQIDYFIKYNTKYNKQQKNISNINQYSLFNLFNINQYQNYISLYLPKQNIKIFNLLNIHQQNCNNYHEQQCIYINLIQKGIINHHLQTYINNLDLYRQNILFEENIQHFLAILITANKIKSNRYLNNQLTILSINKIKIIQRNSLKLSIIQNNYQSQIKILNTSYSLSQTLIRSHKYIVITQQFFKNNLQKIHSFNNIYNTDFIINFKQQIDQYIYQTIVKLAKDHIIIIKKVIFTNFHQQKQINLQQQKPQKQFLNKIKIIQISFTSYLKLHNNLKQQQKSNSSEQFAKKSLIFKNHPCIKYFQYHPLQIKSSKQNYIYVNTILGQPLLVSKLRLPLYEHFGSLTSEVIFFIIQNIKQNQVIFIINDLFIDDLILINLAKMVTQKNQLYSIYKSQINSKTYENLKTNNVQNKVTFEQIAKQDHEQMANFLLTHNFTTIFTNIDYFYRDYPIIRKKQKYIKKIIFFWIFEEMNKQFMSIVITNHKVWGILERSEKIITENQCINYEYMQITVENLYQIDKLWIIVQI